MQTTAIAKTILAASPALMPLLEQIGSAQPSPLATLWWIPPKPP